MERGDRERERENKRTREREREQTYGAPSCDDQEMGRERRGCAPTVGPSRPHPHACSRRRSYSFPSDLAEPSVRNRRPSERPSSSRPSPPSCPVARKRRQGGENNKRHIFKCVSMFFVAFFYFIFVSFCFSFRMKVAKERKRV